MSESFKIRSMRWLSGFIFKYHKLISVVSILFAVLGIVLFNILGIDFKTNIKDMLPDSPKSVEFSKILDEFDSASSLYLLLEGDEEDILSFGRFIVGKIREEKRFDEFIRYIKLDADKDFIEKNALLISKSYQVNNALNLYRDLDLLSFIRAYNDNMERVYFGDYKQETVSTNRAELGVDNNLANIERFMELLIDYLERSDEVSISERAGRLANLITLGESVQISQDRKLLLITIQPRISWEDAERSLEIINDLDSFIKSYSGKEPSVNALLGGMWAMQRDELKHMEQDMKYPPLIALVLVILLFIFSFRASRGIFFVILSLILALCWEIGLITVFFGKLTMMSSAFGIILVGLGVDFGIHLVTQYTESRGEGSGRDVALEYSFVRTGYGIILGGITTSIAFYTLGLSDAYSMQEFGLVTGSGIVLCVISMIIFLPSLLVWFDKKQFSSKPSRFYLRYSFLERLGQSSSRYSYFILLFCVVLTIVMGYLAMENSFEYDMLKIEPQEAESIIASRKVLDKFEMSTDYVMVALEDDSDSDVSNLVYKTKLSALEKARRISKVVENNSNVAFVDSVESFVPPLERQEQNLQLLSRLRDLRETSRLSNNDNVFDIEAFIYEIDRLEKNIIELGDLTMSTFGDDSRIARRRAMMIREIGAGGVAGKSGKELFKSLIEEIEKDEGEALLSLSSLSIFFEKEMDKIVSHLSSPREVLTLDNLPSDIKTRYLSKDGKYNLATIFIKDNIWNMDTIKSINVFFDDVKIRHLPLSYFYGSEQFTIPIDNKRSDSPEDSVSGGSGIIKSEKEVASKKGTAVIEEDFAFDLSNLEEEQKALSSEIEEAEKELKKDENEYISFTGTPSIMFEGIETFAMEGKRAIYIALIAMFVLILLYTRSLKYTLITLSPVVVGFVWMTGVMYLSGIKFDFFNIMALPIILGIGVDDGIHLIHRFQVEGDDRADLVLRYTGRAILLTSLTNVFAFGTISIFSSYVGLAGFGAVLSYGVVACFLVSILLIPSLIHIFRKKQS